MFSLQRKSYIYDNSIKASREKNERVNSPSFAHFDMHGFQLQNTSPLTT